MENLSQRRRQNEQAAHRTSNQRYTSQGASQQSRSLAGGATERYRPAPLSTPPSTARGMPGTGNYSTYYQESTAAFSAANMPATALAYGSDYGQDSRQQQTQGFGGYNTATMMYNVAQPSAQTPVYDTQQFGSRQPAAMHMMTPDVTSTYFNSETGSAANPGMHQQAQTSGSSGGVYQTAPSMGYGNNMPNVNTMQPTSTSADVSMADESERPDSAAMEEKWINYQCQLGLIFKEIGNGSLENASETLLSISSWLLSQVAELGLHLDDANLHADRIKLWNDFNHAWLALGQRQKDMMQSVQSGQPLARSQSLMPKSMLEKLGNELLRLCDGVERHGLVDYQYGVWEERIVEILEDCLNLYEASAESSGSGRSR